MPNDDGNEREQVSIEVKTFKVLWIMSLIRQRNAHIQGDQKISVHLMITIQRVTSNVQSVPRQSPDVYWRAELCSRRPCSVQHGPHSECILWWPSSAHFCFLYCNRQVHRDFLITLYSKIRVLSPFLLHVSALIAPSLGRIFCMLKTVTSFCDYIVLQLLCS